MKIDTEQVIETYKDRIFAIGLTMLKNPDDAEDVAQETFLKYHTYKKDFESKKHIESWLSKVAINKLKIFKESFGKENKYLWKIIWQRYHLIDHRMKNYFKQ